MDTKRINPYTALLSKAQQFAHKVKYRHTVDSGYWKRESINGDGNLRLLYERAIAADQLGYDALIVVKDGELHLQLVKRVEIPYDFI